MDEKRELLRHTVATLAYRASRAIEGAPPEFAGFSDGGRMPVQIVAHMGDLFRLGPERRAGEGALAYIQAPPLSH